jgi:hypothetical protein
MSSYDAALNTLPEPLRSQLLQGMPVIGMRVVVPVDALVAGVREEYGDAPAAAIQRIIEDAHRARFSGHGTTPDA